MPLSTGCTTWSKDEILSDSRPHHGDRKRCVVKDGVTSHAVCCHAPALECHLVEKISADKEEVHILDSGKIKPACYPLLYFASVPFAGGGVLSVWVDND